MFAVLIGRNDCFRQKASGAAGDYLCQLSQTTVLRIRKMLWAGLFFARVFVSVVFDNCIHFVHISRLRLPVLRIRKVFAVTDYVLGRGIFGKGVLGNSDV